MPEINPTVNLQYLPIGSSAVLQVSSVYDPLSSPVQYYNGGTLEARITDMAGVAVLGQTWPLALAYVAASNGIYRGMLLPTLVLTEGRHYLIEVVGDFGGNLEHVWRGTKPAQYQEF